LIAGGVLMVAFGANTTSLDIGMPIGVLLGAVATASVAGTYALSLTVYPTHIGILSPLTVGAMVDAGWSVSNRHATLNASLNA
jgi:hypothetical protein